MKNLKTLLLFLVMAPLFLVTQVGAIAREDGTAPEAAPGEMQILRAEANDEAPESTLEQRLEARKLKHQQHITVARSQRLRTRCVAAQGKIQAAAGRINGIKAQRTQVYEALDQKLQDIVTRLAVQDVNTTAVESALEGLRERTEAVNSAIDSHAQALADMAEMDCRADPEAFQASLEEARNSRQEVIAHGTAVREYIVATLRPALQELKAQLNNMSVNEE